MYYNGDNSTKAPVKYNKKEANIIYMLLFLLGKNYSKSKELRACALEFDSKDLLVF